MRQLTLRLPSLIAASLLSAAGALPTQAGLLSFGDVPIFLGTSSEPNIFFVIDDSGSMDWEVMSQDFAHGGRFTGTQPDGTSPAGSGSVTHRDGDSNGNPNCNFNSGTFHGYLYGVEFASNTYGDDGNDCNTADEEAWRFRNADFNPLYFNPNVTYTPWAGVDASGNPFGNIDVHDAPDNPFLSSGSQRRIDLTQHDSNWRGGFNSRGTTDRDGDSTADGFRYYTYNDADGDGRFDDGEETEVQIKDAPADVQQNFANWFSYYRSREHVAKAAYGQLIAQAGNVRMGLATLHNHGGVNIPAAPMNADTSSGNKRSLLDSLYSIHSNSGTPLRDSLDKAGRYLECTSGGFFSSCPAESSADGGSCQQNFAVIMTDGGYNGSFNDHGNADGDDNTTFDGGAYAAAQTNTLGDIAMHYYERDIQPALANNVPTIPSIDEAEHQHMVTYGVAFGVVGNLTAMPTDPAVAFSWPDPFSGTSAEQNAARIDDLRHAAYNGRGRFLNAQNPQELVSALNETLGDIGNRVGSAAAVALNSASLNTDTHLYQARFDTADWSGQLLSFPITSEGTIGSQDWDASEVINTQDFDAGRTIITYRSDSPAGVPFRFADLSSAQQGALDDDPTTTPVDNDGEGAARLNWLRGDDTHEGAGNNYRIRSSKLGDLVHSAPFFVGPPNFTYPDALEAAPYSTFRTTHASRQSVVYVGANDGMLHGFNAETGTEVLAYVPEMLFPRLASLSDPAYIHQYFVDGTATVGDAFVSGSWTTTLVGSLRGGGQGIFALDVTSPGSFTEANASNIAMWEFTDEDDADLGFVFGQPSIFRMANGKWAAIFGNGYNNSAIDSQISPTGHASLFIVFLQEGIDGTWAAGDFVKIDTGVGTVATPNGLAAPAPIDVNGDIKADYIYAGDLLGNLWKFDVTSADPAQWKVAYQSGGTPQPLFTACTDSPCTTPQPITTRPEVGVHPAGEPGFIVYFGTGKYIEQSDNDNVGQDTQTYYGIWDKNASTLNVFDRSHLLEQQITEHVTQAFDTDGDTVTDTSVIARLSTAEPIVWHTGSGNPSGSPITSHLGWRMDLLNTQLGTNTDNLGERQVSNSILRNGRIIFTTLIPSNDPCTFGGSGVLMELDAADGSRLDESPFDFTGDGAFDDDDLIGSTGDGPGGAPLGDITASGKISEVGIITSPTILSDKEVEFKFASGSTGAIDSTTENPGPGTVGRQSWKQLR